MYLTYIEYKNMGGTLDETTFNDYEFQAECEINWYTFNRLKQDVTFPDEVKKCVYRLISILQSKAQALVVDGQSADGSVVAGVASQSNDGVSISFNTLSAKDMVELAKTEISDCINKYLQGVMNSLGQKVLYRGIYANE